MAEPIGGFAVSLDRGSPVPLYFQVATQLEQLWLNALWGGGHV